MSKITLNFFGETILIERNKIKSLSLLREEMSKLFFFSLQDAKEVLLTYNEKNNKKIIENDKDLNTFLNSNIKTIDLDISQNSQIYKDNFNQLQEENIKKTLESLLKKKEELKKLKETKFNAEKKEIEEIHKKITELSNLKKQKKKKISNGIKKIEKKNQRK